MAISFVGFTANGFANATSGSFTLPAGWADGDLGVFWWFTRSGSRVFTKPTAVDEKFHDTVSDTFGQLWVGYRHLVTGDSTFGWTCTSVTNQTIVFGCNVFSGTIASGDPFEATSGTTALQTTAADVDPPAVTVVNSGAAVIIFNGKMLTTGITSDPSGYTNPVPAAGFSTTLGNDASLWTCYKLGLSPGTEDPGTWDFTQSTASGNLTWTAAISPPAAPSTFTPKLIVF